MFYLVSVSVGISHECEICEKEFFAVLDTSDGVVEWHNSISISHFISDCELNIIGVYLTDDNEIFVGDLQKTLQHLSDNVSTYSTQDAINKVSKDCKDLLNTCDVFKCVEYKAKLGGIDFSNIPY